MTETIERRLPPGKRIDLVLGAGGVEGPAHIGVLRCLEERQVTTEQLMITGASVGALIGTFIANGYNSAQLKEIFLSENFRYPRWDVWQKCLHWPDPSKWFPPIGTNIDAWANYFIENSWPWMVDFKPWLEQIIREYKLKPQPNLRLVAADFHTHKAVLFEGTNYSLLEGLAASTAAISGLGMRPVWLPNEHPHKETDGSLSCFGHLLVDGFYHHPIPADLCQTRPAIVSKIGFASQPPSERLSPWDLCMHLREMFLASTYFDNAYPDPEGHIIIQAGMPDVASTNFGVSLRTLEALVEHGYKAACERLADVDLSSLPETSR